MTTLQKILVAATIAVLVGTGIYQAHTTAALRHQVQDLQQQQAPLAAQIQQLRQERDDVTNQLAELADENKKLNKNSAELTKTPRPGRRAAKRKKTGSGESQAG